MRAIHLVSCMGVFLAPGVARAVVPETSIPPVTPYVERGMLYAQAQGAAYLGLSADTGPEGAIDTSLGLSVGITDRLSLDAALGTVTVAPSTRYSNPGLGLWYGLVDTRRFELDATTRVNFGVGDGKPVSRVEPGATAIFRLGRAARFDVGTYLPIKPGGEGQATTIGARAPMSIGFQLGPYFHTTISSGITIEDLVHAKTSIVVPLAFALGVSARLPGGGSIGLTPSVSWPRLLDTGRTTENTPIAPVLGATFSVATP